MKNVSLVKNEEGQAITEYILLLAIIVGFVFVVFRGLDQMGFARKLTRPIHEEFARAYQYGHPRALGPDDGGPRHHPRFLSGDDTNFRIFINPRKN